MRLYNLQYLFKPIHIHNRLVFYSHVFTDNKWQGTRISAFLTRYWYWSTQRQTNQNVIHLYATQWQVQKYGWSPRESGALTDSCWSFAYRLTFHLMWYIGSETLILLCNHCCSAIFPDFCKPDSWGEVAHSAIPHSLCWVWSGNIQFVFIGTRCTANGCQSKLIAHTINSEYLQKCNKSTFQKAKREMSQFLRERSMWLSAHAFVHISPD